MKPESKSAINRKLGILFAALFLLTGCADTKLPTWITGEPDDTVLNAPRAVARPAAVGTERAWPNLADVPVEKPAVLPLEKSKDLTRRLIADHTVAEEELERVRNLPMPAPMGQPEQRSFAVEQIEGRIAPVPETEAVLDNEPMVQAQPFSALRP